jgi:tRNA modification GTPase
VLRQNNDTIVAIATAQGQGGIGVVRVSGQDINNLIVGIIGKLISPRIATYCNFFDNRGDTIDIGIALFFPAPHSFTGEHVLELQGHGGPVVLQLILTRCLELGARLAEPGEFSFRAFQNNKIDLAQAESIADLIAANSVQAAQSALRSYSGVFSTAIHSMVAKLIELRVYVESMLDFPEEDIPQLEYQHRDTLLNEVRLKLKQTIQSATQGKLLREGANIVIGGQPNVGKSSLLNCLAGDDISIVSNIPGTTRDLVRQHIQISGVPLHIIDTAGLRQTEDIVESMGISRAQKMLGTADLILYIVDASKELDKEDISIFQRLSIEIPRILILNKIDIVSLDFDTSNFGKYFDCITLKISSKTGAGIDELRCKILQLIGWQESECGIFTARERHMQSLHKAELLLEGAETTIQDPELFAEELRLAQISLNEITGEFSSDDLLGEIFSSFCIGK